MAAENILTCKVLLKLENLAAFTDWQAKLNNEIALQRGFISLEILSPVPPEQPEWLIVQRFNNPEDLSGWRVLERRQQLMVELEKYGKVQEDTSASHMQGGITEVFVTQVIPENERAYCTWIAKIHQVEAKFPGFKGVYMQSPHGDSLNWITLLQFDTTDNLDRWLNSPERRAVLEEGKSLIASLESHRVISPYAGWFASIAKRGELPPAWKQTMLVLLVLFPIVMLELKYLSPLTASLNLSLGTFIGNAISVTLVSWPMMPFVIFCLGWWLAPKPQNRLQVTLWGIAVMILLYLAEILLFWNLI